MRTTPRYAALEMPENGHRHRRTVLLQLLLCALLALLLAACGAVPQFSSAPSAGEAAPNSAPQEPQMAQAQDDAGIPGNSTNAALNRRLIARAYLDLVVENTQTTLDAIDTMLVDLGGFISNTNLVATANTAGSQAGGELTLRVPAENLEAAMEALRGMALDVRAESVNREDVTDQYSDVDAQLRNLRATEEELIAMLAEVRERPNSTAEDILAVHMQITNIRGQIEQVQGRKNMLDNLIGLSTIEVSITPDSSLAPVVEEGWKPASVVRDALRELVNSSRWLGDFAIWLVLYIVPILLLIAIPVWIAVWALRWLWRKVRPARQPAASTTTVVTKPEILP